MFTVEIISPDVVVSERGARFQHAIAHIVTSAGRRKDKQVRIPLPRGVQRYEPGTYRLGDDSFYPRVDILALFPRLVPVYAPEVAQGDGE